MRNFDRKIKLSSYAAGLKRWPICQVSIQLTAQFKTYGIYSGFDTDTMIKGMLAPQQAKIDKQAQKRPHMSGITKR
jgi:hypothetical protein